MRRFLSVVLVLAVTCSLGVAFAMMKRDQAPAEGTQLSAPAPSHTPSPSAAVAQGGEGTFLVQDFSGVAKEVMPSIVGISTATTPKKNPYSVDSKAEWSMGSGIVVSSDGYILTNAHVIGKTPQQILVTLANGKNYEATQAWSEPVLDVAIVKIEEIGLKSAKLGDSKTASVGEPVIAVGNPLSLQFERTVTAGIVSAVNRTISVTTDGKSNYMEDLLQTDAAINAGNSGGPLINKKGEVIGINTIKVVSAEGMGFAVPINICKPVISAFATNGSFVTPYLGVYCHDVKVSQFVDQDFSGEAGLVVAEIDPDGPAYAAGVRKGDIIRTFNGSSPSTMIELREALFHLQPGNTCSITVSREGEILDLTCTLVAKEEQNTVTR